MNEYQKQFLAQVQAYFGKQYTPVMAVKVAEVLPKTRERLSDLMNLVIRDPDLERFGRLPGVATIEGKLRELYDRYPEYRSGVRYTPPSAQLDDSGGIPEDVGHEYVRDLVRAFNDGELNTGDNPEDTRPTPEEFEQRWLKEEGYLV